MILLSFDIEEFDLPLEYGQVWSLKNQLKLSARGTNIILDLLDKLSIKATFYCTATFAQKHPDLIKKIVGQGHELAFLCLERLGFDEKHLSESKEILELTSGQKIFGFRMLRLFSSDNHLIELAGYKYNSSINPTWIPRRYNNFDKSRTVSKNGDCIDLPVSVSPILRIPLFWLSFHHLPCLALRKLTTWTHSTDNYVHLYFHPWEFVDLRNDRRLNLIPSYITKKTGPSMIKLFEGYLTWAKAMGMKFVLTKDFLQSTFSESWD